MPTDAYNHRYNEGKTDHLQTNFMLFKPRQIKYHFPMQTSVNEQRIEHVKETVFLGVVLDEHQTWKPHA